MISFILFFVCLCIAAAEPPAGDDGTVAGAIESAEPREEHVQQESYDDWQLNDEEWANIARQVP